MNGKTVIVIGNGFDLDLGWHTSYKDFYDVHKGWNMHKSNHDDLFQYVIKCVADNWFDFERTFFDYAIHRVDVGLDTEFYVRDIQDYYSFKDQLFRFIAERSKQPIQESSFAYQLLKAYIDRCKRFQHNANMFLNWFSFNYTPLDSIANRIDSDTTFNYIPVHGTIAKNNIIFGIQDDDRILPEYRPLLKSMDDNYNSQGIVKALLDSNLIIFFGLSMGYIDSIYFKKMFNSLSDGSISPSLANKEIIFITKDVETKKAIKNNLLDMGLQLQILFNMSNVDFIYTSDRDGKENLAKFESLLSKL
jgi:hypothetical protein